MFDISFAYHIVSSHLNMRKNMLKKFLLIYVPQLWVNLRALQPHLLHWLAFDPFFHELSCSKIFKSCLKNNVHMKLKFNCRLIILGSFSDLKDDMSSLRAHHHSNWILRFIETNRYQFSVENKLKKMSSVPNWNNSNGSEIDLTPVEVS